MRPLRSSVQLSRQVIMTVSVKINDFLFWFPPDPCKHQPYKGKDILNIKQSTYIKCFI